MRKITFLLFLFVTVSTSFSQTTALDEAKEHLKEMNDVVNFTSLQKEEILEIFKECVESSEALDPQSFEEKKDFIKVKTQLYVDAKRSVYQLCTQEQLMAYKNYRKERQTSYKAMLAKRNHAQEYYASQQ